METPMLYSTSFVGQIYNRRLKRVPEHIKHIDVEAKFAPRVRCFKNHYVSSHLGLLINSWIRINRPDVSDTVDAEALYITLRRRLHFNYEYESRFLEILTIPKKRFNTFMKKNIMKYCGKRTMRANSDRSENERDIPDFEKAKKIYKHLGYEGGEKLTGYLFVAATYTANVARHKKSYHFYVQQYFYKVLQWNPYAVFTDFEVDFLAKLGISIPNPNAVKPQET